MVSRESKHRPIKIKDTENIIFSLPVKPILSTYNIIKQLGNGAYGSVALVSRRADKVRLALKKIHLKEKTKIKHLEAELGVLKKINNIYILKLEEAFICTPSPNDLESLCLVTELGQNNLGGLH